MKPSFLNLFMKKFTREWVVPSSEVLERDLSGPSHRRSRGAAEIMEPWFEENHFQASTPAQP
jgi:hypothetical protein